ncbi:MAG: endolytic transglycosylase MltG [Campylobacteraceae bacterium]|nr:endolytic transglycosylase MltG [Campylobacteraceae bacterium]
MITFLSLLFYLLQPVKTQKIIYVPQGGINKIITQLAGFNTDIYPFADKLLLFLMGYPQAGWIDMGNETITKADFLYRLTHAKAALRPITLVPGETSYVFLEQLSYDLNLSIRSLKSYYKEFSPIKDGWIIPNTYNIPIGIDEKGLISYLINTSNYAHKELSNKLLDGYNEDDWSRILTIASIIQKESASIEEMPIVSSVIYNRLKINMKLQMDGTLNYGKFSHVRVTPQRIREDKSLYNTYMYNGLPPNPVCAVSKEAIKAAVNPVQSEYLYFVKGKDGNHIFSKTYQEHLKNIKK